MKLSIEKKGSYQYTKILGKSVSIGGKVRKADVVYLKQIINLDKGILFNKERMFTHINTDKYEKATPEYLDTLTNDRRKKEK